MRGPPRDRGAAPGHRRGAHHRATFVLTVEDPGRFPKNREVGAYLGLVPRQRESGERAPQLRISKSGDAGLRRLLVQAAHYILGPFGPAPTCAAGVSATREQGRATRRSARSWPSRGGWRCCCSRCGRAARSTNRYVTPQPGGPRSGEAPPPGGAADREIRREDPSANEASRVMPNTGDCDGTPVPSRRLTRLSWQRPLEAGCAFMHRARCAAQ